MEQNKSVSELRRGVLVFTVLAVSTGIEYFLGTIQSPAIFLWVIAILKAALVLVYFMHFSRLFGREGERE
jgi:caa(3)-type oxidase subunit IV